MIQYHFSFNLAEHLLEFAGKNLTLKKNKQLLYQGQPLTKLLLITSGTVSFSYDVGNGRRLLLGQLDCDHTLIGEVEALNDQTCIYTVTCLSDVNYHLIDIKHWHQLLLDNPKLSIYTAQSVAAKFIENQQINLDKLLLPLSYNIAKDCLSRFLNASPTLLRPYATVCAEAERFATTERAYRRVVSDLVEQGLVQRTDKGLKPQDETKLSLFIDHFHQK